MNDSTGDRIRSVRKRRGLTQKQLAERAGLSVSWISHQEQGIAPEAPLETLHKVAVALKVPTSALAGTARPPGAHPHTAEDWAEVRDALRAPPQPEAQATADGVLEMLEAVRPMLAANRYSAVAAILPPLIRDARTLGDRDHGARSRVLNLTAWLLTQTRQWADAGTAAQMAIEAAAGNVLNEAAAVNTLCWSLLRQGQLTQALEIAAAKAGEIEPRFSAARPRELALWGRLLLAVTNAAVRDNRPDEAADALSLASAAAERIGREISADGSTTRTFGPVTVRMIAVENAVLTEHPDQALAIARDLPPSPLHPLSASRCRHRLDVANAHVMLRDYDKAIGTFQGLQEDVPEWLAQQRYARVILADMTGKRRLLTKDMRELAEAIHLPLLTGNDTSGHAPSELSLPYIPP
jgi:transcriptional regulator with XRE-family HTH domain